MKISVTDKDVCDFFEGIMIPFSEPFIGTIRRPGWECKRCGWKVAAQGLPPSHDCISPTADAIEEVSGTHVPSGAEMAAKLRGESNG